MCSLQRNYDVIRNWAINCTHNPWEIFLSAHSGHTRNQKVLSEGVQLL